MAGLKRGYSCLGTTAPDFWIPRSRVDVSYRAGASSAPTPLRQRQPPRNGGVRRPLLGFPANGSITLPYPGAPCPGSAKSLRKPTPFRPGLRRIP